MFVYKVFKEKVTRAASGTFTEFNRFKTSSIAPLVDLVESGMPGEFVLGELKRISADKKQKYGEALAYLIEEYPDMTKGGPEPLPMSGFTFANNYNALRGDLVYGIHPARVHPTYNLIMYKQMNALGKGDGAYFADNYNNRFGIGNANAFRGAQRKALPQQKAAVGNYVDARRGSVSADNEKDQAFVDIEQVEAYYECLQGSRFNPVNVFDLDAKKLTKEAGASELEKRKNKAVRRVCKLGLHMVATHPKFRGKGARVHFLLDCMGDLSSVAKKLTRESDNGNGYVPITSSELCYCFRNWEKEGLKHVVYFYVDGNQVNAPWEENWTLLDCQGANLYSGYLAWQRYALKRLVLKDKT
jgi:hypothetical protein